MADKKNVMISPEDLNLQLRRRLQQRLPGRMAQRQFAHELSYGRHFGPPPADARRAAVLIILRWQRDHWLLPLTLRQHGLRIHSGQISLPGGGIETTETAIEAALRECKEELGWAPNETDVMGKLSPVYVYASNYLVIPVVAVSTQTPEWKLNRREVAELIEIPVAHLCSDESKSSTHITRHAVTMEIRCFRWKSYCIWGATAIVLAELRAILTMID